MGQIKGLPVLVKDIYDNYKFSLVRANSNEGDAAYLNKLLVAHVWKFSPR